METTLIIKTAEVGELRAAIDRADYLYHNGIESGVTDAVYDRMKARLRELAPNDDRLDRVGPPADVSTSPLTKVQHEVPMPSLNNAMSVDEFRTWIEALSSPEVAVSYKLDGIAIDLRYEAGVLVRAATRGPQGATGSDITHSALRFHGVPRILDEPVTVNIRGEAVLHLDAFERINERRTALNDDPFKNPRNAAAGIIQRSSGEDAEHIAFYAHNLLGYVFDGELARQRLDTKGGQYEMLSGLGFTHVPYVIRYGFQEVVDHWNQVGEERASLPYWIDGLVVFSNSLEVIEQMGITSRRPKAAIAFKWKAEQATTVLKDIEITVGRTGKIAPTAILEPVELCGTTNEHAYLHNQDNIDRLRVAIGDTVVIERGGEIIPQVIEVAAHADADAEPFQLPDKCPVCDGVVGNKVNVDKSTSVDRFCLNPACPAKAVGRIERWIKSLEIKGIGDALLAALVGGDDPEVKEVQDLYKIAKSGLRGGSHLGTIKVNGRNFGRSRADAVKAEIEKTTTLTIPQFVGSLNIPGLGKRRVELILKAWNENGLADVDAKDLNSAEPWFSFPDETLGKYAALLGIPNMAARFCRELKAMNSLAWNLSGHVEVEEYKMAEKATGSLSGKSFCLTGTMSRKRDEIAADIVSAGGEVKKGVSAGLTYLVQADPTSESSKSKKAAKVGTSVIGEEELMAMMG